MPAMSWRVKADLMVRRGEARSFSEACSMLAKRRRPKQQPQMAAPARCWSPYKED